MDAFLAEARGERVRRLIVDQEAVNDRFTIAVREGWVAENLDRVCRWSCGESDAYRIEVVEHASIRRDVIIEIAQLHLALGHPTIERVAAMRLVNDDAVVLSDGHRLIRIKDPANHR